MADVNYSDFHNKIPIRYRATYGIMVSCIVQTERIYEN